MSKMIKNLVLKSLSRNLQEIIQIIINKSKKRIQNY